MPAPPALCPQDDLAAAAQAAEADTQAGLSEVEQLLRSYRRDPRLHFLKGSLLAALQRYAEAETAMKRAVAIAPDFHIARFQLGLLQLSSGAPDAAVAVWRPLTQLGESEPLRLLAEGLGHMARDEFALAAPLLRRGMALNRDYPALNRDMQLLLDGFPPAAQGAESDGASSEAHWLLQQAGARPTKH